MQWQEGRKPKNRWRTPIAPLGAVCKSFREKFGSANCGELTKPIEWGGPNQETAIELIMFER